MDWVWPQSQLNCKCQGYYTLSSPEMKRGGQGLWCFVFMPAPPNSTENEANPNALHLSGNISWCETGVFHISGSRKVYSYGRKRTIKSSPVSQWKKMFPGCVKHHARQSTCVPFMRHITSETCASPRWGKLVSVLLSYRIP
jgi:hypothetical protein